MSHTQHDVFLQALEKAIATSDMSSLSYVGLIGSVRNDVDIMFFPSPDAKIGGAILATRRVLAEADKELSRGYVVPCSLFCMQPETYYLAGLTQGKQGQVPVHDLFFPDKASLLHRGAQGFEETVRTTHKDLFGNYNIKDDLPEIQQEALEPYFVLQNAQLLHSYLPPVLLVEKTRKTIGYMNRFYETHTLIPKNLHAGDCERLVVDTFAELDSKPL